MRWLYLSLFTGRRVLRTPRGAGRPLHPSRHFSGGVVLFEAILGFFVLLAANGLYIDMKRKGRRGLGRIILFWMGTPFTWLWFFGVKEGKEPEMIEPPDDADALLAEIRRDRALRGESSPPLPPGEEAGDEFFGGNRPPGPQGPGGV